MRKSGTYEDVKEHLKADKCYGEALMTAAGYQFEFPMLIRRLGITVEEDFKISPVPACSIDEISCYIKEHYAAHGFECNGEDPQLDGINRCFEDSTAGHISGASLRFAKDKTYLRINVTLNRYSEPNDLKVTAMSKTI